MHTVFAISFSRADLLISFHVFQFSGCNSSLISLPLQRNRALIIERNYWVYTVMASAVSNVSISPKIKFSDDDKESAIIGV